MRGYAFYLGVVLGLAGCGGTGQAPPATPPPSTSAVVNPAAVTRVRGDLPPGYEVADMADHAAPVAFWGFKPGWTAEPSRCGALADPSAGTPTRGFSASGSGGIIHVVVAGPGATPPIPAGCADWTVSGGGSSAEVTAAAAPAIADTPTVAMSTVATTVVEGGTETRSHADTAIAYLDSGYVAFVTVVTDPGSVLPALGPDVATRLLVQTVTAIRR